MIFGSQSFAAVRASRRDRFRKVVCFAHDRRQELDGHRSAFSLVGFKCRGRHVQSDGVVSRFAKKECGPTGAASEIEQPPVRGVSATKAR